MDGVHFAGISEHNVSFFAQIAGIECVENNVLKILYRHLTIIRSAYDDVATSLQEIMISGGRRFLSGWWNRKCPFDRSKLKKEQIA